MNIGKLVIYSGVYNEARFVSQMIESVLAQTYTNFDFVISDNHSTDGSTDIIKKYAARDSRIKVISPPAFLTSLYHGQYIVSTLKNLEYQAALYIGGHDIISPDYVMGMMECLAANPSCVIAYPKNAFEIDADNQILKQWGSSPQTIGVPQPFKTLTTLLTLIHNIPLYGVWRYDVFNSQAELPRCIGGDHFFVAKATLAGDIVEASQGQLYLRRVAGAEDYKSYQEKHFGSQINIADDMMVQLRLLADILGQACAGFPEVTYNATLASATALYIMRFSVLFQDEQQRQQFFSRPEISAALGASVQAGALLKATLSQLKSPSVGAAETGHVPH